MNERLYEVVGRIAMFVLHWLGVDCPNGRTRNRVLECLNCFDATTRLRLVLSTASRAFTIYVHCLRLYVYILKVCNTKYAPLSVLQRRIHQESLSSSPHLVEHDVPGDHPGDLGAVLLPNSKENKERGDL